MTSDAPFGHKSGFPLPHTYTLNHSHFEALAGKLWDLPVKIAPFHFTLKNIEKKLWRIWQLTNTTLFQVDPLKTNPHVKNPFSFLLTLC